MTLKYTGVNLAGLEFGQGGTLNDQYVLCGKEHYDYWSGNVGANTVRLPFNWERLQPQAYGELNPEYLSCLQESVSHARANDMTIILDLHNYARYYGEVTDQWKLGDVWKKLADHFGDAPDIWFNLMNEPYEVDAGQWADITQSVVNQLREVGIDNKLLLSGTHWSGAHAWIESGNAEAYDDFTDPLNNYAFDVHQYLDGPSSGFSGTVVDGSGSTRLVGITEWAKAGGHQLFLGETGAADATLPGQEHAHEEIVNLFEFMNSNSETWLGFTLWGAGPWWGEDYVFNINPGGLDTGTPVTDSVIEALKEWMQPAQPVSPADGTLYAADDLHTLYAGMLESPQAANGSYSAPEEQFLDLGALLDGSHPADAAIQAFVAQGQPALASPDGASLSGDVFAPELDDLLIPNATPA